MSSHSGVVIIRFDTTFSILSFDTSGSIPPAALALLVTGVPDRVAEVIEVLVGAGFSIKAYTPDAAAAAIYTLVKH